MPAHVICSNDCRRSRTYWRSCGHSLEKNDSAERMLVSGCVLLPLHSKICRRRERTANDSKGSKAATGTTSTASRSRSWLRWAYRLVVRTRVILGQLPISPARANKPMCDLRSALGSRPERRPQPFHPVRRGRENTCVFHWK